MQEEFSTTELYKWLYEFDLDQKAKLDSNDKLMVGIYALLSGLATFYFGLIDTAKAGLAWSPLFWCLSAIFSFAFVFGSVCLIISMLPRYRKFVVAADEFAAYEAGLVAHYTYDDKSATKEKEASQATARQMAVVLPQELSDEPLQRESLQKVRADMRELLVEQLIDAGAMNRSHVLIKTFYQVRAKWAAAIAVLAFLLNGYPAYVMQKSKSNIQKIDMIELPNDGPLPIITVRPIGEIAVENRHSNKTSQSDPPAQTSEERPPKPDKPKAQPVREGVDLPSSEDKKLKD